MTKMDDENNDNVVPLTPHKDKPFVEMSDEHRDHTFGSMMLDIHRRMLKDARAGRDQDMEIAATILHTDGEEKIVSWSAEHGDGEGLGMEEDTVRSILKFGLLKEGERLEVRCLGVVKTEVREP